MFKLPSTIKARFYLAMGVMAVLFLGAGLTSISAFYFVGRTTRQAQETNLPAIETGYLAAARAHIIANDIQNFVSTSNPARLDYQYKKLSGSLEKLVRQIATIRGHNLTTEVDQMRRQAETLSARLTSIYQSRMEELQIENQRRLLMRKGNETLKRINEKIQPIKNNAGFELNVALYGLINEKQKPTDSLRRRFFESDLPNFQYSLEVESSAGQAHALLTQAFNENNPRVVSTFQASFQSVADKLQRHMESFGPDAKTEDLKELVSQLTSLGLVPDNLFQQTLLLLERRAQTAKAVTSAIEDASHFASLGQTLSGQVAVNVRNTAEDLNALNHRGTILVIILTGLGLLLAATTAWVLVGRMVINRLYNLRNLMELGQKGVYIRDQIPLKGIDEIADICRALDFFLNRIEQDVERMVESERDIRASKEKAEAALAELHMTQESLIQSEKLASIATLVAGVAHELNTPLGAAVSVVSHLYAKVEIFGEHLKEGRLKKSDVQRFYDFVTEGTQILQVNIDRTIELIERFKQLSRDKPMDQKRVVNLNEFLAGCLADREEHLRDRQIDVSIYCPDKVNIKTHPVALSQIMTTLIMNSLTHAYDADATGHINILANTTAQGVTIVYEDNGCGMTEEQTRKIFDPYQSSIKDGEKTGLGMLLVHNLVTLRLGGEIAVESSPGNGTRFELHLPMEVRDQNAA